jgi:hypothetical protein
MHKRQSKQFQFLSAWELKQKLSWTLFDFDHVSIWSWIKSTWHGCTIYSISISYVVLFDHNQFVFKVLTGVHVWFDCWHWLKDNQLSIHGSKASANQPLTSNWLCNVFVVAHGFLVLVNTTWFCKRISWSFQTIKQFKQEMSLKMWEQMNTTLFIFPWESK